MSNSSSSDSKRKYRSKENEDPKEEAPKTQGKEITGRTGGVYIPPFKLAQMQRDINDNSSLEYQKVWII
jgi:pre-mRNA-splicing factor CWC22